MENKTELLAYGKIMEVLGSNSQTLMIEPHNTLIQDFLKLFDPVSIHFPSESQVKSEKDK
jgi:hypothetical protein